MTGVLIETRMQTHRGGHGRTRGQGAFSELRRGLGGNCSPDTVASGFWTPGLRRSRLAVAPHTEPLTAAGPARAARVLGGTGGGGASQLGACAWLAARVSLRTGPKGRSRGVPHPNPWARTSEFLGFRKNTRQLTAWRVREGGRAWSRRIRKRGRARARRGAGGRAPRPRPEAGQPDSHGARDWPAEEAPRQPTRADGHPAHGRVRCRGPGAHRTPRASAGARASGPCGEGACPGIRLFLTR